MRRARRQKGKVVQLSPKVIKDLEFTLERLCDPSTAGLRLMNRNPRSRGSQSCKYQKQAGGVAAGLPWDNETLAAIARSKDRRMDLRLSFSHANWLQKLCFSS
jgi:hypothetical protein